MKRLVNAPVVLTILFSFVIYSMPAFAQVLPEPQFEKLTRVDHKVFDGKVLAPIFDKLQKVDEEIRVLTYDLQAKKFSPLEGTKNYWGMSETYRTEDKKTITLEVYLRDFSRPNSKDVSAIGQFKVSSGDRSEVYSFSLLAPKGDFEQAIEYTVDENLKILKADSWWRCVKKRLIRKCAGPCVTSIIACSGTWAAYIGCVALACGGCFTRISACCGCN